MSFIRDLQLDLAEDKPIGPILMKLRLLAARLGSAELEVWVKHETEGYPNSVDLPDYRVLGMSFIGQFSGAFGSGIKNAPIPPVLIKSIAGDTWEHFRMTNSAASIDSVVEKGNGITLDLANLALLIQGKVYENMACNQLTGYISHSSIVEVSNAIRNRVLELTIELEKSIPELEEMSLGNVKKQPEVTKQIFNQTIYGDATNINSTGDRASISVSVSQGSHNELRDSLLKGDLTPDEASELARIIESEPLKQEEGYSLGEKARAWIGKKVDLAMDTGVKGGIGALTQLAHEAALQFWGLK